MAEEIDSFYQIPVNPSEICERAFELMREKQFDDAEKFLNKSMGRVQDDVSIALIHSALGVLYKMKGEPKTAWKHYSRAEKLIPDDPALKLIMARLLIDQFAEYDQAIKKSKKALDNVGENPVFKHQAFVAMGLAYLGKGQGKKAVELLNRSIVNDFSGFVTVRNIDFTLVEMLLRRDMARTECRIFLEKAHAFAENHNEEVWADKIGKMLSAFPKESR